MFGLGPTELVIVLIIIMVLFGWNRLPQMGKGLGEGIRNFRQSIKEQTDDKNDTNKDKN